MINDYNYTPVCFFPTSVLIADMVNSKEIGGVRLGPDLIPPGFTKVGGATVSAALEVDSQHGGILFPRLIQENIDQMIMTDGMMFYNKSNNSFQFRINGATETFTQGSGNIAGPGSSTENNLAIWGNNAGTLLKNSSISIGRIILGPISSTNNHLALWNNTDGTSLSDSGVLISDIVKVSGTSTTGNLASWNSTDSLSDSNLAVANVISSLAGGPDGNIAVFDSVSKSIKDSGINISRVPVTPLFSTLNNREKALVDLNRMENLNIIQFSTNGDNANDAYLSISDNVALMRLATLVKRDDSGIGSIIVSQSVAPDMSNTSAILEIQSTTQALLVSRMSTTQADAIPDKKDGMILYDNVTKKFKFREDGVWNQYNSGTQTPNITLFETEVGSETYVVTESDDFVLVNTAATDGSATIVIPDVTLANKGRVITIKKVNNDAANYFVLLGLSNSTIDNDNVNYLLPKENFWSITLVSDGVSNWSIVDYYSGVITSNAYRLVDDSNYGNPPYPEYISKIDNIIGVNLTFEGILYLGNPSLCKGREFTVKDESGTASPIKRIVVEVTGGGLIDGSLAAYIDTPYSSLTFYSNGYQYFIK